MKWEHVQNQKILDVEKKDTQILFLKNIFGLGSSSLWKLKGVCGRGFYEY